MSISLYDKCWIKTKGGKIHGPAEVSGDYFLFDDKGELKYSQGGVYFWAHDHERTEDWATVVAVYESLEAASRANPGI